MRPEHTTKSIVRNNYDGKVSRMMEKHQGKADYVVELKIPRKDLVKCTDERDVVKHVGDVDLSKLDYKIYKRGENN